MSAWLRVCAQGGRQIGDTDEKGWLDEDANGRHVAKKNR